jgi:hypothetical protein
LLKREYREARFHNDFRKRKLGYICNQGRMGHPGARRGLDPIEASRTVTPTVIGTGFASARANLGEALKSRP